MRETVERELAPQFNDTAFRWYNGLLAAARPRENARLVNRNVTATEVEGDTEV